MSKKKILSIIAAGILLRLIFAYCFTYSSDFQKILVHVKSIALTGNFFDSMRILFKVEDNPQLYGKIWYQITAIWLMLLDKVGILSFSHVVIGKALLPYQQFFVKLIQLPYDLLLLYYMVRITDRVRADKKHFIFLFWSFNPLWMYIAYAMFQADLAMILAVMAGIYYTLNRTKIPVAGMLFFAFGFIVKLMPLLLMPFVFLYLHQSHKKTLINMFLFCLFAVLLIQPWSRDFIFMRKYNFNSYEAISLFHEQWNGASVFALMYLAFLLYAWVNRAKMQKSALLYVIYITLVVIITLVGETYVLLYPQYMLWLMPLAAVLTAAVPELFPILFIAFFGFVSIAILNMSMLTGAFTDWLGNTANIPFIRLFTRFFHEKIVLVGLRTALVADCFVSIYLCIRFIRRSIPILDRTYSVFANRYAQLVVLITYNLYYVMLAVDWFVQRNLK